MGTFIAGMVVLGIIGAAVCSLLRDRKSGKVCAGCGGNCGCCTGCGKSEE